MHKNEKAEKLLQIALTFSILLISVFSSQFLYFVFFDHPSKLDFARLQAREINGFRKVQLENPATTISPQCNQMLNEHEFLVKDLNVCKNKVNTFRDWTSCYEDNNSVKQEFGNLVSNFEFACENIERSEKAGAFSLLIVLFVGIIVAVIVVLLFLIWDFPRR